MPLSREKKSLHCTSLVARKLQLNCYCNAAQQLSTIKILKRHYFARIHLNKALGMSQHIFCRLG